MDISIQASRHKITNRHTLLQSELAQLATRHRQQSLAGLTYFLSVQCILIIKVLSLVLLIANERQVRLLVANNGAICVGMPCGGMGEWPRLAYSFHNTQFRTKILLLRLKTVIGDLDFLLTFLPCSTLILNVSCNICFTISCIVSVRLEMILFYFAVKHDRLL